MRRELILFYQLKNKETKKLMKKSINRENIDRTLESIKARLRVATAEVRTQAAQVRLGNEPISRRARGSPGNKMK